MTMPDGSLLRPVLPAQLVHEAKAGLPNTYNALVYGTFCVGSYLFTLGCFLMTVPIINEVSIRGQH